MKTLVIGGTAFMGRAIVERLVARGDEVSVLHRRAGHDLGSSVRNLQADRSDLGAVAVILRRERFEAVFDLAYDWQAGTPASHIEAAARNCGDRLHRYVFMSSIAAYVPGLDRRETDPLAPDDVPNPYAQHKASAERMLFRLHDTEGFPAVTIRPPFVHGPRQPFYREQFFWDRLRDHRPIVLPDGGADPMQWAYVADVADACVRALEVPDAAGEAFNIAHAETSTQRGFVETLARVAGVEPSFAPVSRAAIAAAGGQLAGERLYFGEFLDLPPYTERVDKAQRLLGFTPTPLDVALRAGFDWHASRPRREVDYAFEDRLIASG